MILITGACASGKRTYALSLGFQEGEIVAAEETGCVFAPVVYDVQNFVRDEGADAERIADALSSKKVVICTEMGSGIVPLTEEERAWRNRAGRLACLLSSRAETVVRMVCGIPQVVKGGDSL